LESTVWEDCREVILHPGEALEEAPRQLHTRLDHVRRLEKQRGSYMQALAEKVQERDRILTLHRRGRIPAAAVEAQLDEIAREEAELRQQCSALETQKVLAEASEAHFTDTRQMLQRLQGRLEEIERTNNQSTKREVIERLVHGIRVDTDRKIRITITYAFKSERVAYPIVPVHGVRPGRTCHTYDVP
jgi:chromosome segregation ATPase